MNAISRIEVAAPSLSDLITVHRIARRRFVRASDMTDNMVAQEEGRKVTAADQRECDRASIAERSALLAIVNAPVAGMDVSTKAAYLRDFVAELDEKAVRSLLATFARAA